MSALSVLEAGSVLLVGAGKMGMAMARGWIAAGLAPEALTLVDPTPFPEVAAEAARWGARLSSAVPAATPRVVVLAVKPQNMAQVLTQVRPACGRDTLVLSIAAGISLSTLAAGAGTERVVRAMPNLPAQIGKGVTGAIAGRGVAPDDRAVADALLSAAGTVEWIEAEALMDAVTAVSGSGPAYVFHLVEALAAAGAAQGLEPEQAMAMARRTVIGAGALLEADPSPAAQLRETVTSPGGTTAAALAVLMDPDTGLPPLMAQAVDAARRRSKELDT